MDRPAGRPGAGARPPGTPRAPPRTTDTRAPWEPAPTSARPLFKVTFAVVDVETTGGSPATAALTEIGAAKYQRGNASGVPALVDPRCAVPPLITLLTGIADDMVRGAPPV